MLKGVECCIFCAEKAKKDSAGSYHNNDDYDFFSCDCDGVKDYHAMNKALDSTRNEYDIRIKLLVAEKTQKIADIRNDYQNKLKPHNDFLENAKNDKEDDLKRLILKRGHD